LGKGNWNTEEYTFLPIMPLAIMQILSLFEDKTTLSAIKKNYHADLVNGSRIGSNKFLVGWGAYYCKGYPSKSFGKINYYASTRMIANLKRRSQRGYRTLSGKTWTEILERLGVFRLRKGYYSHA